MSRTDSAPAERRQGALAARRAAIAAVIDVLDHGRSLSECLPRRLSGLGESRGLAQELAYGTLRWHGRLSALVDTLLDKPLKAKDRAVATLLETGLYQLIHAQAPPQWIVSECVDCVRALRRPWAAGLVNGSLRRFAREQQQLLERVDAEPHRRHAHPEWLVRRLREDWPEDWAAILAANNRRPPMTLRVNAHRVSPADYRQRLEGAGIPGRVHPAVAGAIELERPAVVEALPGFEQGDVSVQDAAAQLAAILLDPQPGERLLDACAAPGGKSGHLLERCGYRARLTALDSDEARLEAVAANLRRLGAEARLVSGDAGEPAHWWDGRPFDRILLDAPCSATGVIRRHPDIKWLRRDADIAALATEQQRLLRALWPLLAPGGKVLYATCSVLEPENEAVITAFRRENPDAQCEVLGCPAGRRLASGWQVLPGDDGLDGFYYACLRKAS